MTWTLLNRYTSNKEVQYRIDCITRNTSIEQLHWTKNGNTLANGTSNLQTLMIGGDRTFVVITTMEYESAVITCSNQQFSRSIVVEGNDYCYCVKLYCCSSAPSGPPSNVWVVFQSSSSITVNWSPPVGGADGYVILYSVEGTSNMTLLVEGGDQTSSLLTGLSKGHLYTISMFAYKNLNSQPSHPMNAVILESKLTKTKIPSSLTCAPSPRSNTCWFSIWRHKCDTFHFAWQCDHTQHHWSTRIHFQTLQSLLCTTQSCSH